MTGQHLETIGLGHQLADLLAHAPRGFVGHAQRPLQLLAAHAVAGRDEQVDGVEPALQRRAAVLKDRAGARVDVVAASGARVGRARGEAMEGRVLAALLADVTQAVSDIHDVSQAGIVIRELAEEVFDGELGRHGRVALRLRPPT